MFTIIYSILPSDIWASIVLLEDSRKSFSSVSMWNEMGTAELVPSRSCPETCTPNTNDLFSVVSNLYNGEPLLPFVVASVYNRNRPPLIRYGETSLTVHWLPGG